MLTCRRGARCRVSKSSRFAHRARRPLKPPRKSSESSGRSAQRSSADSDIDIVDCGTRPSLRHSMVLPALRNGKHVYNGIPFAVLEAARRSSAERRWFRMDEVG